MKETEQTPITESAFEEYYASDRKLMDRSQLMKRVVAIERAANAMRDTLRNMTPETEIERDAQEAALAAFEALKPTHEH